MTKEIENIELDLLLECIFLRYGYDFRQYARASMRRRVQEFLERRNYSKISELIPLLLYDEAFFQDLVHHFSITVTEMFRDPDFFHAFRQKIVPVLQKQPFVKLWHAGCATGEEIYSVAIVLLEENLANKTITFATDFNNRALHQAKEAIYALGLIKKFTKNYQDSGGKGFFSDYYSAQYESVILKHQLKDNITFAHHNLANDGVFGEMNLIICRNVMIYFDRNLQERVFRIFDESLVKGGILCLGSRESLQFSGLEDKYEAIDEKQKIFRKR